MQGKKSDEIHALAREFRTGLENGSISRSDAKLFLSGRKEDNMGLALETRQMAAWSLFFQAGRHSVDLSNVRIPQQTDGYERLIIVPSTITANDLLAQMKANFDVWVSPDFNGNLDGAAEHDERGGETYAIWVHDSAEADEHLKNLCASDISKQSLSTITLRERLLLGMFEFFYSRQHHDVNGGTLCSGSRLANGKVPCVDWSSEDCQLRIATSSDKSPPSLTRARQVIP